MVRAVRRRTRLRPCPSKEPDLHGVVLVLTIPTSSVFPFALLLEAFVVGDLARDVLRRALDALTDRGCFLANRTRLVSRCVRIVRAIVIHVAHRYLLGGAHDVRSRRLSRREQLHCQDWMRHALVFAPMSRPTA